MDSLLTRHRNAVVLAVVLLAQVILLAWQVHRPDSEVPLLREWVAAVVSPPQRLVAGGFSTVRNIWDSYIDLRGARKENLALVEELGRQRVAAQELRTQILEMQRVQSLVAYRESSASTLLVARVIGSGASDQSRVIFLNKGKEDGVRSNMAVITPDGIVGKVQRVFQGSAQVLLITDEDSGVGALFEATRVHGILRGQNSARCQVRYVLNDEKVQVGDKLLTSGEDRVFPKGLPVGTVSAVEPASEFKKITVDPAARMNRLEDVLIVIRGREVEIAVKNEKPVEMAQTVPPDTLSDTPSVTAPPPSPDRVDHTDRPGIPHGARPETDADKIHANFHQKTLDGTKKSAAPAATPPATTRPPTVSPPAAAAPPATKPPATKPPAAAVLPATVGPAAKPAQP